jgi:hypothetical protein
MSLRPGGKGVWLDDIVASKMHRASSDSRAGALTSRSLRGLSSVVSRAVKSRVVMFGRRTILLDCWRSACLATSELISQPQPQADEPERKADEG